MVLHKSSHLRTRILCCIITQMNMLKWFMVLPLRKWNNKQVITKKFHACWFSLGRNYWSSSRVLRANDQRYYLGIEPLNSIYFNGRTEPSKVGWLKVTAYIYPSSQQMWTEVAPAITQKAGPRNHTLLSFTTSIPRKRKLRILQAQVRRMVVSSSGLDELVKSFQRIGKTLF